MKTKAQTQRIQVAEQALIDFTADISFEELCDTIYLLVEGRGDFDEPTTDKLCSRLAGIAWKRRRGLAV